MSSEFDISEELKKLPSEPGVYIMRDADDRILYVGKAVSLKNRVRQYFQSSRGKSPKIVRMVSSIDHFEYIVTDSELEALVLESNLIKEHRPKYNTMLKDDKSYPYIKVTLGEDYPRVVTARGMKKDNSKYYGPYPTAGAVKDMIELVRKLYRLRSCSRKLPETQGKGRPCLYHHIGQCDAPCVKNSISKEEYREHVNAAVEFLNGNVSAEVSSLTAKMQQAAEELRFEEAAAIRDLIESIRTIGERQKITMNDGDDRDVIALAVDDGGEDAVVQVFFIRDGRMIGREHFFLSTGAEDPPELILRNFVMQYYAGTPFIPKELMLMLTPPDKELLEAYLTERRGAKVQIRVPQRGIKEKLVEMARENAAGVLMRDRERLIREDKRTKGAVKEIEDWLELDSARRMEAYDISNISGVESVGSMIVYEDGRPKKNDYRKFRIRTVTGPNDYASMEEVLTRRFQRAKEHSSGFDLLPDLLLMDGGKGQVHIAEKVINSFGMSIPVAGMVKDEYHRTRGLWYHDHEVPVDTSSEWFKLITRIQDEAHRFAIEYHRQLRSKGQIRSVLDEIEGIGETRRKALLRAFGSTEGIREASLDELAHAESMNRAAAEKVWNYFHKEENGAVILNREGEET